MLHTVYNEILEHYRPSEAWCKERFDVSSGLKNARVLQGIIQYRLLDCGKDKTDIGSIRRLC